MSHVTKQCKTLKHCEKLRIVRGGRENELLGPRAPLLIIETVRANKKAFNVVAQTHIRHKRETPPDLHTVPRAAAFPWNRSSRIRTSRLVVITGRHSSTKRLREGKTGEPAVAGTPAGATSSHYKRATAQATGAARYHPCRDPHL